METRIQQDPKLKELLSAMKGLPNSMKEEVWQATLDEAVQMEQDIKNAMPVDTGRAKAGWGHWTPEDLQGLAHAPSKRATKYRVVGARNREQVAMRSDAVWEEDKANLTVMQGTTVPYTQYLEEGHSSAAPAGFIEAAETSAQNRLKDIGERLINKAEAILTGASLTIPSAIAKYKPAGAKLSVERYVQQYRKALGKVYPSEKKPIRTRKK